MKTRWQKMAWKSRNTCGFTLIEMLIVIIILGILAMVIIPQITVSTEDAKVSTLKTNLSGIRGTIEVYYAQHKMVYPGVNADGSTDGLAGTEKAFVNQLTQFTDIDGKISGTKTGNFIYGPYIKGGDLPANPFVDDQAKNKRVAIPNPAIVDVTAARTIVDTPATGYGWAYRPGIGIFYANDSLAHAAY